MSAKSKAYNYFKYKEASNEVKSDLEIKKRIVSILGLRDYTEAKQTYAEPTVEAYNKIKKMQTVEKEQKSINVTPSVKEEKTLENRPELKITMLCGIEDVRYRQLLRIVNF